MAEKLNSNIPDVYSNYGLLYKELGEYEKAIEAYQSGQRVAPAMAEMYVNEAIIQLMLGNLIRGWDLYHMRWTKPGFTKHKFKSEKEWTGQD